MDSPKPNEPDSPQDWSCPKPEVLARPTWWPAALAFGAALLAWGIVTSFIILGIGLAVFMVSLAGWIGEIRSEQRESERSASGPKPGSDSPSDHSKARGG